MGSHPDSQSQGINAYLQRIATEFAFLEAGSKAGVEALRSLIEETGIAATTCAPQPFITALEEGFDFLEQVSQSGGWTDASIQAVIDWYSRLENILLEWEKKKAAKGKRPPNSESAPNPPPPPPEPPTESTPTQKGAPSATHLSPPPAPGGDEPSMSLGTVDDRDLLNEFCNEAQDLLQDIEKGVLILEQDPSHRETLNSVFRAFHTFKGSAGYIGLGPVKLLAHELESLLDAARRGDLPITTPIINVILAGGDALRRFMETLVARLSANDDHTPISVPILAIMDSVRRILNGESPPAAVQPVPRATPEPPVAPDPITATPHSTTVEPVAPAAPAQTSPAPQATASPNTKPSGRGAKTGQGADGPTNFVKLDTLKLDSLVDLVGELVIAQSMVVQHPDVQSLQDRQLARFLRQLARITTDLQHNAMSLRMVPIRGTFQKMNRLVRDLASSQGKKIQLQLAGEETELDRNIVEELSDPLIHMIRNSADHGVETPAEREAKGKSPIGTIRLQAFHQGGGIVIRISDDGRGLDKERILAKALQKGLIEPNTALSEKEIFELIFAPGFSTAEKVTEISGRGVGMDVVRGNISRLRGRIEVDSVLGQGSTFTIFLPLTLAIIDGLLVSVGSERFILPTLSVRECLRVNDSQISTVQGRGELISVRGKLMPLTRLGELLGIDPIAKCPSEGIIVVAESGTMSRCLLVDEMLGKKEVVIKSLGDAFKTQSLLSGAAILGDGRVALILDVDALTNLRAKTSAPN
jgi:two-component system chemotaxis sensor kinase CheA